MKPWYKLVTPREDLRTGKPLDASEFAVNVDHVRAGKAPPVYQDPAAFFERTYLTKNLLELAVQAARRLNGVTVETSPVFNLSTQFGGGKTHALTLLYHLARGGDAAKNWKGVAGILRQARQTGIPDTAVAVFVGTEQDLLTGRGGDDGTPLRKTPWGEIAFQLGGAAAFALVAQHDETVTAPGGDVIDRMLPKDRPTLILMDELLNYAARTRKQGMVNQLYHFLQNLSETAKSRNNVVLAVSIPASEMEMTTEDEEAFDKYRKLLDRLGKSIVMSAEAETSEIIRRRLFEWNGVPAEANETLDAMAEWIQANKAALPSWFPHDKAREQLAATYPFHPSVLSVFDRKWRALPRFQQTRGVLRLLALWVARAYSEGYKGAHKDTLITLGTAPLDDSMFRAALFDQLGEARLEGAVTTDIAGAHAHAVRLDIAANDTVRKTRLHRKIASAVLFESNGGQLRGEALAGDIRLAVAEPGIQVADIEPCLEALVADCYYLTVDRNRYRFSFQANLNKILADRRAAVPGQSVHELVREEARKVFALGPSLERVYFPSRSNDVPDRPALTLAIVAPAQPSSDPNTAKWLTTLTQENGASARTFKSAVLWAVAEDSTQLNDEARKVLAWRDINDDSDALHLDDAQTRQLAINLKAAEGNLKEAVWRSYRNVFLLSEDNTLRKVDLGLIHSSSSTSLTDLILNALRKEDLVADQIGPSYLLRFWPPALPEWSTKSVRDAFHASPKLPRPFRLDVIRKMIATGVGSGHIALVTKAADGSYDSLTIGVPTEAGTVELVEDVYIITAAAAKAYKDALQGKSRVDPVVDPDRVQNPSGNGPLDPPQPDVQPPVAPIAAPDSGQPKNPGPVAGPSLPPSDATPESTSDSTVPVPAGLKLKGFSWAAELPPQKWMNFYTKILAKYVAVGGVKLSLQVDVRPGAGMTAAELDDVRSALRELGLPEELVKVVG